MTARKSTKGYPTEKGLTAERLRTVLDYDQETGIFSWRVSGLGIAGVGAVAGAVSGAGNAKTYVKIRIDGVLYFSHRLAFMWMTGSMPAKQVDHIDGNGLNNKWSNLREYNQTQNLANILLRSNNTSGLKGTVSRGKRWIAQISVNKVVYYLGTFDTREEAATRYDEEAASRFGEFARTNRGMGLI